MAKLFLEPRPKVDPAPPPPQSISRAKAIAILRHNFIKELGSTDGESNPVRVPFCARQLFGDLRRRTSAGQVPAAQLIPLERKRRAAR